MPTLAAVCRLYTADPVARERDGVALLWCGIDPGDGGPIPPDARQVNGLDFQRARVAVYYAGQRVLWLERYRPTPGMLWLTVEADMAVPGASVHCVPLDARVQVVAVVADGQEWPARGIYEY